MYHLLWQKKILSTLSTQCIYVFRVLVYDTALYSQYCNINLTLQTTMVTIYTAFFNIKMLCLRSDLSISRSRIDYFSKRIKVRSRYSDWLRTGRPRGREFESRYGQEFFPRRPNRLWGPPSLLSDGLRGALSPWVKRPEHEADHSPPASAEVKKTSICSSTPPYAFMS
jgi:hypothetical protein